MRKKINLSKKDQRLNPVLQGGDIAARRSSVFNPVFSAGQYVAE
ncbi:hypothetical protein HMPREF9444_01831 [Succinatimonas hippei YIT 12066]|uniref:Uncharacterized protein n=1 Tax=Succinatimonas hippei (strain DSM 22608 / JCM 16073 / KCTC 15190 / YIT 12066) TaxID=762983 RepID=E8LM52_SUCHY|nr:hypothetical protein HMPREF9444_01831 [Succinatimonas hippei YIT 12066]